MVPPVLLFAFLKEATVPMIQCWQMVLVFCATYSDAQQQNLKLLTKETPIFNGSPLKYSVTQQLAFAQ